MLKVQLALGILNSGCPQEGKVSDSRERRIATNLLAIVYVIRNYVLNDQPRDTMY